MRSFLLWKHIDEAIPVNTPPPPPSNAFLEKKKQQQQKKTKTYRSKRGEIRNVLRSTICLVLAHRIRISEILP